jgi:hypothetical protein
MIYLFQVISLEGWTDIMYYVQDAHSFWDWIYFVLLIVVSIMGLILLLDPDITFDLDRIVRLPSLAKEVCTSCWWGNQNERDHWGDTDVDGRIILRWMFRKWEGVVGTGWSWAQDRDRWRCACEYGNELSGLFHKMRGIF